MRLSPLDPAHTLLRSAGEGRSCDGYPDRGDRMDTQGSGASRAGGEGFHNEDAFLVEEGLGLYVVCDGASAWPGGEFAARAAASAARMASGRSGRIS